MLVALGSASIQSTEYPRCGLEPHPKAETRKPSCLEDRVDTLRKDEVETVAGKRNGERNTCE